MSYEAIISVLVILFGIMILIKPTFFSKLFKGKGAIGKQNTLSGSVSFDKTFDKNKAIFLTKVTGIIFIIFGILAFSKYVLFLF